ncbi:MAG: isochorismate synthase MenF [Ktedonobacteraceae bacterium]
MTNILINEHAIVQGTFLDHHRSAVLAMLHKAVARATQLHRNVIASCTLPIERYDTIQAFAGVRQAGLGEVFFWEQPSEQNTLIGVGTEATIETTGTTSAMDAATQWRTFLQDAVISPTDTVQEELDAVYGHGPVFFGGFAFDPDNQHTQLWAGFPDGLLILPRFLLRYSKKHTALTINVFLHAEDDVEQCFRHINDDTQHLLSTIRRFLSVEEAENPQGLSLHADVAICRDDPCALPEIQDTLPATIWMQKVAGVAASIRQSRFEKVVLARSVQVTPHTGNSFDISAVLSRLRQSYPGTYIFAVQRSTHFFVGATPERLVQAQNGQIHTMALAGSSPRGTTLEEDERLGTALLQSEKNSIEHAIVVATVREALLAHCSTVRVSDMPHLLKLKNVQHLETPIVGDLLPGRCILDVMADLHPTPAVGGFPRKEALAEIRRIEELDRGWYAGPLGWIGAGGHGEFAVALRSGLIAEHEATLFAGCGIVGDSDPQSEYAESCLKLQGMLRGLGEQE